MQKQTATVATLRFLAFLGIMALALAIAGLVWADRYAPRVGNTFIRPTYAHMLNLRVLQFLIIAVPLVAALFALRRGELDAKLMGATGYELLCAWAFVFAVAFAFLAASVIPSATRGRGPRNRRIAHERDAFFYLANDAMEDASRNGTLPRSLAQIAAHPRDNDYGTPAMTRLLGGANAASANVVYLGCGLKASEKLWRQDSRVVLFYTKRRFDTAGRVVAFANGQSSWVPAARVAAVLARSASARLRIGMPPCKPKKVAAATGPARKNSAHENANRR